MKLLKNIFLFSTMFIVCSAINAVPNFELLNKSKKTIELTLSDQLVGLPETKKSITKDIAPGQHWNYNTQKNSKIMLKITDANGTIKASIYSPNKTTYLTYNPAKTPSLYPQTGPFIGMVGNTQSGLPLKNNVKSSDISQK